MTSSNDNQFENKPGFIFNPLRACLDKFRIRFETITFKLDDAKNIKDALKDISINNDGLKITKQRPFTLQIDPDVWLLSGSLHVNRSTSNKDYCELHIILNLNMMRYLSHNIYKSKVPTLRAIKDDKFFWRKRAFLSLNGADNFLPKPFTNNSTEYDFSKSLEGYMTDVEKFIIELRNLILGDEKLPPKLPKWYLLQAEICWDFEVDRADETASTLSSLISNYNPTSTVSRYPNGNHRRSTLDKALFSVKAQILPKTKSLNLRCYAKTRNLLRIEVVFDKGIRRTIGNKAHSKNFPNQRLLDVVPFTQCITQYASDKVSKYFNELLPLYDDITHSHTIKFIEFMEAIDHIVGNDLRASRRLRYDFFHEGVIDANNTLVKKYIRKLENRNLVVRIRTTQRDSKKLFRVSDEFKLTMDRINNSLKSDLEE